MKIDYIRTCRALAAEIARKSVRGGRKLGLQGGLGVGKTAFARTLISEYYKLHGFPAPRVPSPTYAMVEVYDRTVPNLWHFDFYRLKHVAELRELGWAEALSDFILAEWPERLGGLWRADEPLLILDGERVKCLNI